MATTTTKTKRTRLAPPRVLRAWTLGSATGPSAPDAHDATVRAAVSRPRLSVRPDATRPPTTVRGVDAGAGEFLFTLRFDDLLRLLTRTTPAHAPVPFCDAFGVWGLLHVVCPGAPPTFTPEAAPHLARQIRPVRPADDDDGAKAKAKPATAAMAVVAPVPHPSPWFVAPVGLPPPPFFPFLFRSELDPLPLLLAP